MSNYSIEELIEVFTDHHEKYLKQNEENIKSFKENSPEAELPEWYKSTFSLPLAFLSMCEEILKLKSGSLNKHQPPVAPDSGTEAHSQACSDSPGSPASNH